MKVIVVGAGVSGLCTAWALVKKGVEVTLLEQGPIPNPLSASGDQSSTTLFYVFDVVDSNGARVHRIVGQESAPGSSGDPWSGPNSDTLERAARRAVTELVAWIRR